MFCPNCGKEIQLSTRFCEHCGTRNPKVGDVIPNLQISATSSSTPVVASPAANCDTVKPQAETTLTFHKGTMVGNVTFKRVESTVTISDTTVILKKSTWKMFGKTRTEEGRLSISDIASASVHTVLDFWDTLYAIIFVILAILLQPVIFLLAAVCLWTGYGKRIDIIAKDGAVYAIPAKGCKQQIEALLKICNS